ncbi:MAG: SpoIIE family protein phosphatase [Clostridia bacterium]|nr:SpoIIE family protein phosphatase [Clostridia bacterium]
MRGTIKEYTRPDLRSLRTRLVSLPVMQVIAHTAAAFACAFFLSGASAFGAWLPCTFCLCAILPLGLPFLAAGAGAAIGSVEYWGIDIALAPICIVLLIMTAVAIFNNTVAMEQPLFMPLITGGLTLVTGLIFFFDVPFSLQQLCLVFLRGLLAVPVCLIYRKAVTERERTALLLSLVSVLHGLCGRTVFALFNPGLALAMAVSMIWALQSDGLLLAALCGLAADVSGAASLPVTAVLCLASETSRLLAVRRTLLRFLAAALCGLIALISLAVFQNDAAFSLCFGAAAGLCVPLRQPENATAELASRQIQQRLRSIANVFSGIRADNRKTQTEVVLDPDQIFDRTAERVCRGCLLFHSCWESSAEETCTALRQLGSVIHMHGGVEQEDFPASFTARCRHMEQFTATVNEELELLLCRRQYKRSLAEHRLLLQEQMDCTAGILRSAAESAAWRLPIPVHFRLETGFSTRAKELRCRSGDQCMCAELSEEITYIVLCDGMGTGEEAERAGKKSAKLLMELLLAGCAPTDALRLLNTAYLVQADGVFSAVDVLRLDLSRGQAELYKWGSSASYLKRFQNVKTYGKAAPPPGLGIGKEYRPEKVQLSLRHGEILVLTTDGAAGEKTCERLRSYVGANLPQLAGYLVHSTFPGTDDASVIAVRLYPKH